MIGLPHSIAPCPILVVASARHDSDKYQFLSHWFDSTRIRTDEALILDLLNAQLS